MIHSQSQRLASSELSPQSSRLLQRLFPRMHFPLLQVKCSSGHAVTAKEALPRTPKLAPILYFNRLDPYLKATESHAMRDSAETSSSFAAERLRND